MHKRVKGNSEKSLFRYCTTVEDLLKARSKKPAEIKKMHFTAFNFQLSALHKNQYS